MQTETSPADEFASALDSLADTAEWLTEVTAQLHTLNPDQLVQIGIATSYVVANACFLEQRIRLRRESLRKKEKLAC